MNKLFHQLSWEIYLQIALLILTAYYLFIAVKFFRNDFVDFYQRFTGQAAEHKQPAIPDYSIQVKPDLLGESSTLVAHLDSCIQSVVDKPFAPAILIPKLKKILNDYPEIAASPDRELINDFIVEKCEKTGTALLSESEVDMWWSA
jgi:hypothetical protein